MCVSLRGVPAAEKKKLTTVAVRLEDEIHWAWKRDAAKAGLSLSAYVIAAVEEMRVRGDVSAVAQRQKVARMVAAHQAPPPTVDPAKCTRRRHAGAYCRSCGAIHTKGI